jgi:hypothetical protein
LLGVNNSRVNVGYSVLGTALFARLISRSAAYIWLLGLLCGVGAGGLAIYALSSDHVAIAAPSVILSAH